MEVKLSEPEVFLQINLYTTKIVKVKDRNQNIRVTAIPEELHNVIVFERLVDGDFLRHFLFGMLFDEQRLGHDFPGQDLLRVQVFQFVAAGESSFAHEFALLITLSRIWVDDQIGHLAKWLPT